MTNVVIDESEGARESALTPLLSSVISALSTGKTAFTGERFVFGSGVEIFYEHYHRYIFAARHITSEQTVLDLGCGVGYGSLILASKAKKVIALDRDQDSITLLQQLLDSSGVNTVQAVCGDVDNVETVVTGPIDVVVCHELIEHLPADMQERLLAKIAGGEGPFHKDTRLFISTPERAVYNEKNREKNEFHEYEFSRDEFASLLKRNFSHTEMMWQGSITGNVLISEKGTSRTSDVGYVHWQDIHKLLGTVTDAPISMGVYMYGIASHYPLPTFPSSILIDQRERLIHEKLAIAASELNQKQQEVTRALERLKDAELRVEFEKQAQEKIKSLQKENERIGAQFVAHDMQAARDREIQAEIQAARERNIPLEIKLATKVMMRMPMFIRVAIRRLVAFGIALRRA